MLVITPQQGGFEPHDKLSEYNFFAGRLADLSPADNVYPYTINTPLFSNYAEKLRFFKLPAGSKIAYRDSTVFDFPIGSILIKNFYYPKDFRKPEKGRTILETRLLVREGGGWQAYPYIWNDEQTEAFYDPAGDSKAVRYVNESGKKILTSYLIPNKNQCKGCHLNGNQLQPLGPSARQMNEPSVDPKDGDRFSHWAEEGILTGYTRGRSLPGRIVWNDASTGSVDDRARAYLDANCAHCHSRSGSANTSGLFLDVYEKDPAHLGLYKSPVAAGRGAGNMEFDIVPGDPGKSILLFRMQTNDPAIAMPEIGREQVHKEGVALIEEWIRTNKFSESPHDLRGK
jgi:uncharacterized repeat protein (TIGR03806 family)